MSEMAVGHIRKDSRIEKLVLNKFFWVFITLALFAYPIVRSVYRELPPELPIYASVGDFSFTNEFSKPYGSNSSD